jgi:hypothetical protein
MDTWTFGLTLALSGMAGTLLVLWCVSLFIGALKKIFPHRPEAPPSKPGA